MEPSREHNKNSKQHKVRSIILVMKNINELKSTVKVVQNGFKMDIHVYAAYKWQNKTKRLVRFVSQWYTYISFYKISHYSHYFYSSSFSSVMYHFNRFPTILNALFTSGINCSSLIYFFFFLKIFVFLLINEIGLAFSFFLLICQVLISLCFIKKLKSFTISHFLCSNNIYIY